MMGQFFQVSISWLLAIAMNYCNLQILLVQGKENCMLQRTMFEYCTFACVDMVFFR